MPGNLIETMTQPAKQLFLSLGLYNTSLGFFFHSMSIGKYPFAELGYVWVIFIR